MLLRSPLVRVPALRLLFRPTPALHKLPRLLLLKPTAGARCMGTRGRNEPKEPLNSPKGAKEFIYRLQPAERRCLLQELQTFESIAVAQGRRTEDEQHTPHLVISHRCVRGTSARAGVFPPFIDSRITEKLPWGSDSRRRGETRPPHLPRATQIRCYYHLQYDVSVSH